MKKILFALPFIFALTACGGGGGGGSSSPSPTQDKTVPEQPVTETKEVVVSESGTQSLPVSNASSLIYTVKSDSESTSSASTNSSSDLPSWLTIVFDSGSITFNVSEVDRPHSITIEFRDKNTNEVDFEVSLFVDNSSGKELVSKVERAISQSDRLLSLENDKKLYFYIVDMLYLQDLITHSEKVDTINSFSPEEQVSYDLASNYLADLKVRLNQYNAGIAGQDELAQQLTSFESAILTHGEYSSNAIESLQQINASGLPALPKTDIVFSESGNVYSRFIGSSEYGQWVDGNWVYNPDFEFLSKIVNVNLAGTCSI